MALRGFEKRWIAELTSYVLMTSLTVSWIERIHFPLLVLCPE